MKGTLLANGLDVDNVVMGGLLPSMELVRRLRMEADVLFVPESFEEAQSGELDLSFPSKLTDYTATALPLLIWGPKESAAVRWASSEPGVAAVVTEPDENAMAVMLKKLAAELAWRRDLGATAFEVGKRYFSARTRSKYLLRGFVVVAGIMIFHERIGVSLLKDVRDDRQGSSGATLEKRVAANLIPISVVIPTWNRAAVLRRTLESLAVQSSQPAQIILVDASQDKATQGLCVERRVPGLASSVVWELAQTLGAASQRNQGVQSCRHAVIGFFDDDILFEPECVARLWGALQSDTGLGGVSAMITNQRYQQPGGVSRLVFRIMAGRREVSYAGRVLGPAVNLLPEDREGLPEVVPVQWLNTTCALYRREALPDPPFARRFSGYSMMEDLTLSLTVSKRWRLANARTARIFHDFAAGLV